MQKSDLGKVNSPPLLQTQGMMPGAVLLCDIKHERSMTGMKNHANHWQNPTHDEQFMTQPCILQAEHWLVELPHDVTKRHERLWAKTHTQKEGKHCSLLKSPSHFHIGNAGLCYSHITCKPVLAKKDSSHAARAGSLI